MILEELEKINTKKAIGWDLQHPEFIKNQKDNGQTLENIS